MSDSLQHDGLSVSGLLRQEQWSGLPCPPPGDPPHPGIEPVSLRSPALAAGFFTTEPPGKPTLVPYCSGFYGFVVYFEIEKSESSNFVLFLNCFGYPGSLYFHKNVRISSSISTKMLGLC